MTSTKEDGARAEEKATWSVVVVYEDPAARERAMTFCDQLVGRFWTSLEFDVNWWSFDALEGASPAQQAADKAAQADVIVFSASPEGDFPLSVKDWIRAWLSQRGDREGKLVALLQPLVGEKCAEAQKHFYLRNTAHHGSLDYLTEVPEAISLRISESLSSYSERADQVTSLLDNILHQQTTKSPHAP